MKFLMVIGALIVIVTGGYFGFHRDDQAQPDSPDLLPMTQINKDEAQEQISAAVDTKQLQLSLSQTEAKLKQLEIAVVEVPDMSEFSSKYDLLSQQVELLPSPEHLLDPANSISTFTDTPPIRQREAWRSVMQNYGEATGASTESLEKLFQ